MKILVTGGAGYIGTHTCAELTGAGHLPVILDNFSNSHKNAVEALCKLTNKDIPLYETDLSDSSAENVFKEHKFDAAIHFAGLKAVGESVEQPLKYYRNNINCTLNLLELMQKYGVKNIVFSSSATVYGQPERLPIKEDAPLSAANPYGATKLFCERILSDAALADPWLSVTVLRYFNPIGAHPSGELGEDPKGIPNNLLPYVARVAGGSLPYVNVFGNDYNTPDGTGVRDYIHVCDLARGHLNALNKKAGVPGVHIYNLGTGKGYSVLEVIDAFSQACGKEIPYRIKPRRSGDIDTCYADPQKARDELCFTAQYDIKDMCAHAWNRQKLYPNGFDT